jgi:hypothetical protein
MDTFADLVEAAGALTPDEQVALIAILQRSVVEENRNQLLKDVEASRAEHAAGNVQSGSASEIMDEIRRGA